MRLFLFTLCFVISLTLGLEEAPTPLLKAGEELEVFKRQGTTPLYPTNDEQLLLEYINRLRADPMTELFRLCNFNGNKFATPASNDNFVANALTTKFNVNATLLKSQFTALNPQPPVTWNPLLGRVASYWAGIMASQETESTNITGFPNFSTRVANTGYTSSKSAENINGFVRSVYYAHASMAINWGNTPTGILNPPTSRMNIMSAQFNEIGIGLVAHLGILGPFVMDQDFGVNGGDPSLLGVVYIDSDVNQFYTPGEGIASVNVSAVNIGNKRTYNTTTYGSGGYSVQVPSGTYTVYFTSGAITAVTINNVVVSGSSVKVDARTTPYVAPTATGANDNGNNTTTKGLSVTMYGAIGGGALFIILVVVVVIIIVVVVRRRRRALYFASNFDRMETDRYHTENTLTPTVPVMSMNSIQSKMNVLGQSEYDGYSAPFRIGTKVEAKYSGNGQYYRGQIMNLQGNSFLVKFTDFNETEWVTQSSLRHV